MNFRLMTLDDAPAFHELVKVNAPFLQDYFPKAIEARTSLITATYIIKGYLAKSLAKEMFVFVAEENNELIGVLMIKSVDIYHSKCELGYYIAVAHHGKGIATKGIKHLIDYAFNELRLNKIYCRIATDNHASNKVAEKNNFTLEGILKQEFKLSSGKYADLNYYGLTKN